MKPLLINPIQPFSSLFKGIIVNENKENRRKIKRDK